VHLVRKKEAIEANKLFRHSKFYERVNSSAGSGMGHNDDVRCLIRMTVLATELSFRGCDGEKAAKRVLWGAIDFIEQSGT
jgi:hypothetical protein